MADNNNEKIRQNIVLDLEEARMWASFILPLITLCLTLLFTDTIFKDSVGARMFTFAFAYQGLRLAVNKRSKRIRNAYSFIEQL